MTLPLEGISLASLKTRLETSIETRTIQAVKRDPTAFGDLYEQYVESVFRYLYSRIGSVHAAEDATAQTFLAALESFDRFRGDGHFASWLFGIAHHKAMDHFRSQKRTATLDEAQDLAIEDDPLGRVIRSEQAEAVSKLIQVLPENERELIRLRFLAGLSFAEMGHLLGCSEEAVKKSVYRLLARLHSQLEITYG
jgi:RNA polymerase sigma-70 factor (ECF subfamily)